MTSAGMLRLDLVPSKALSKQGVQLRRHGHKPKRLTFSISPPAVVVADVVGWCKASCILVSNVRMKGTAALTEVSIGCAFNPDITNRRVHQCVDLAEERLSLGIARHEGSYVPNGRELRFGVHYGLVGIVRAFSAHIYVEVGGSVRLRIRREGNCSPCVPFPTYRRCKSCMLVASTSIPKFRRAISCPPHPWWALTGESIVAIKATLAVVSSLVSRIASRRG